MAPGRSLAPAAPEELPVDAAGFSEFGSIHIIALPTGQVVAPEDRLIAAHLPAWLRG